MRVIGIDVSKPHLDLALLDEKGSVASEKRVANTGPEILKYMRGKQLHGVPKESILVCLEPTGHYSSVPVLALLGAGYQVWLAHPTDIQRSLGMLRGKNDKVDAQRIARYAFLFPEKAHLLDETYFGFTELKELLSTRDSMVRELAKYRARKHDNLTYMGKQAKACVGKCINRMLRSLEKSIAEIEQQIEVLVKADEGLAEKRELAMTVPGVGAVLANEFLVATRGFTRFDSSRQFECYVGVAPFEYSSGISIKGRKRVSHRANKRLKQLLHMAALSIIRCKGELRDYYLRKVEEGKSKMSVLNAVRAKIIHRLWAVLSSGSPYKPSLQMS